MLGAINVGTWTFFIGAFGASLGIENTITTQTIFLIIITGAQALINHLGIKLTAKLTDFSGYLIFFGSILIAVVCLFAAETWDFGRLFTFQNYSGEAGGNVWPAVSNWWVFALGLLLPIYTITGYDASAHTSEETIKAAHSVPRAMVMSVVWSAIFGYLFLAAFVLMIPNMDEAAKQGWNVFFWAFDQRVGPGLKEFVYLVVFLAQLLCGLATVTSASRMIFAFSRDGGLPGLGALSKVSPTYRTPVAAIWTSAVLSVLFVWGSSLVSVAGTSAYTIVVSCTVIFLFLSFTIADRARPPGLGNAEMGQDGSMEHGARRLHALCDPLDPVDDPDLHHRHPAAERLGALHHRRLLHPDGDRLVRLRKAPLPGPADRRHHRRAPGRDHGSGKGGRRKRLISSNRRRPVCCWSPPFILTRIEPFKGKNMPGHWSFDDLKRRVSNGEIDTVLACFVDMQGRLIGKRFHASYFVDSAHDETHGCNYLLANDIDMEPVPGYKAASWKQGYGDFVIKPDLSTIRHIPWLEKTRAGSVRHSRPPSP